MKAFFERIKTKFCENQFAFFVAGSLAVALILMIFSLWLYQVGGTAELDLSRPSYQEAREQAQKDAKNQQKTSENSEFKGKGEITTQTIKEFETIYNQKLQKIEGEFFTENALSDETLNLTDKQEN